MSTQKEKKTITRRSFIAKTAASAAALTIIPRHVMGGPNHIPPSEKLNIAGIGVGGKGYGNINAVANENIVALCDVDWGFAKKAFDKYPNAKKFYDFREMFATMEDDIDAVIVATPDHTHAVAAMDAMKRGKHVYVQKPLAHSVHETRALTEAARKYNVVTQMGNQGHSQEGCRLVKEWIAAGKIGEVKKVDCWTNRPVWPQGIQRPTEEMTPPDKLNWDLWLGPAKHRPYNKAYLHFNWRGWLDFGCGALGDMACHVMDAAFWALDLKYPTNVEASCDGKMTGSRYLHRSAFTETFPKASIVRYKFPARGNLPALKLNWFDGGILPERPEELGDRKLASSGTIFYGEKGKIMCGEYGGSPVILPYSLMKNRPAKTLPRVTTSHEQNWIDACKGKLTACSNFDYSGPFTEMVSLGCIASRMPWTSLDWDGEALKITNNEEANKLVKDTYRQGWSL